MHMERLRTVKASLDLKKNAPQKPVHLKTNFKKEQQTIGTTFHNFNDNLEKKNEIQYENRILLKKMLQIDLKPSRLNKRVLINDGARERNMSANNLHGVNTHLSVQGLNSYNSLNRAVRIKDMARIVEDNKLMLKKLQTASSIYSIDKWEQDNKRKKKLVKMLCRNSDRFMKHPYFISNTSTLLPIPYDNHSFVQGQTHCKNN